MNRFYDDRTRFPVKYEHYFPTGIDALDGHLLGGGLRNREVAILAGRPGIGKTAVAAQIAVNLASHDVPVMYIDLERNTKTLEFFARHEKEDEFNLESLTVSYHLPATISGVCSEIKDSSAKVVILDYLQLLDIEDIDSLAEFASVLPYDRAYLIISQLNDDVKRRGDKAPYLSDLDRAVFWEDETPMATILLYRDSYYENIPATEMESYIYRGKEIVGHGHWDWNPEEYIGTKEEKK